MGRPPDDLDSLPKMTPVEDLGVSSTIGTYLRPPLVSGEMVTALTGGVLILVCGYLLLGVFAYSEMATGPPWEGPEYWGEVRKKMFQLEYFGKVWWPASLGFLLGPALI